MGYRSWPLTHPNVLPTPATQAAAVRSWEACFADLGLQGEATARGRADESRALQGKPARPTLGRGLGWTADANAFSAQAGAGTRGLRVQATRPYSAGASRLGRVDKSRALQGKAASPALGRARGWAAAKQEIASQGIDGCNTDSDNKAPPAATATPTLGRAADWGAAPGLGRALGWAAAAKPGHAQLLPYKLCVLVAEVVVELGVSVLAVVVVVVAAVVGAATGAVWQV